MKLADPRLGLSLVTLAAVVLLALRDVRHKASPGPLSPGHAALAELAGPDGCGLCHGAGELELEQACRACHTDIDRQLASRLGLHGSLEVSLQGACGTCHLEHHGAEVELVGALAFARAGIPERAAFDHGHVVFELSGVHDTLACEDCHPHAEAATLLHGARRYVDASQRCGSCHGDPHGGRYLEDCASCHGQERPFAELASYVHTEALPLVGAHAKATCDDCHAPQSAHSIEVLAGPGSRPGARACQDCHDSPHAESFLMEVAQRAVSAAAAACADCHDAREGSFALGALLTPAQHALAGFSLQAPHAGLECAACHSEPFEVAADFATRHPGRRAEACEACHADPHGGQFEGGAFAGAGCGTCHAARAFVPPAFDARLHARSAFPLEPAHERAACADCHAAPEASQGPRLFAGVSTRCEDCHADAHGGRLVGEGEAGCAECHRATRFDDLAPGDFDHAARTRFALEGAHAAADCEACHARAASPDGLGRRFGRIAADFAGREARACCASCHTDVHAGAFDGASAPAEVEGRAGCARCHDTTSFRALRAARFEHERWTGFALEGAHDAVACQACHGAAPPDSGRSLGRVAERYGKSASRCADCHGDVHGGRFDAAWLPREVAGRTDCARCHGTQGFGLGAREAFEHGPWTGFALEGAHAAARCADCHVLRRAELRLGAARGASCEACHADPHVGQFRREGATDCARCHRSSETFAQVDFDHRAASRFALDEQHAQLDCAACHRPWPLPGGGRAVRYKPLGILCTDCHASDGRVGAR
jgi:hypothetical protein